MFTMKEIRSTVRRKSRQFWNGKPIDAIQIYYSTPSDIVKSKGDYREQYRVSPVGKTYYSYQYDTETTGDQDGYAGDYGTTIDRLQIALSK